ncbi:Dehydration-responsive element-binding protein 2B [Hordeum vulgare]|nr:Dehydration-responsive element-binding protein 2B [Hordeum vulgare]
MLQEPQPEAATASTHAQKRPAPAAAADPHPPRPKKRMRVSTPSFTATAPVFLPDDSIPEANDDMAHENIEHSHYSEPDEEQQFLLDEAAAEHEPQSVPEAEWQSDEALGKDGGAHGFDIEELTRMMEADPIEVSGAKTGVEMDQQEPLYLDCLDQVMLEDMLEDRAMHNPAFRDAQKEERYNAAPDLDVPSLQGHDHLFKFPPGFFDAFEAPWKAEEALENEMRDNTAANLLGGYDNFFSSASVH